MNPMMVIAMIQAAAKFTESMGPLVHGMSGIFSSEDQQKIKAELVNLQLANDSLFQTTQAKLRQPPSI